MQRADTYPRLTPPPPLRPPRALVPRSLAPAPSHPLPFAGFTKEEAEAQFGFLLGAFQYGAPPHGGLAFGLDRLCTLIGGGSSIRDYIAFPKNNQGRDVMINAPSEIAQKQLDELSIAVRTAAAGPAAGPTAPAPAQPAPEQPAS
jgi:hypothetical protein